MPETGITCPRCDRTSSNPSDILNRYCGACHKFHDNTPELRDRRLDPRYYDVITLKGQCPACDDPACAWGCPGGANVVMHRPGKPKERIIDARDS